MDFLGIYIVSKLCNLLFVIISHFFLKNPPHYSTCPLLFVSLPHFFIHPPLRHHSSPNSIPWDTGNPPTSSSTLISNSSHWRYLFSATNHNHVNSDETIQNSIHLLFFIFYMEHQSDYWLYYLERLYRLELWRKKRINLCSNIWHILNCSILMVE